MSRDFTLIERVFESALLEEQERLDTSLSWSRTIKWLTPRASEGSDDGDQSNVLATRREREHLADVKAALKRLDEGVYGRCERCDAPIALSLLLEAPWTRCCAHCLAIVPNRPTAQPAGKTRVQLPV